MIQVEMEKWRIFFQRLSSPFSLLTWAKNKIEGFSFDSVSTLVSIPVALN